MVNRTRRSVTTSLHLLDGRGRDQITGERTTHCGLSGHKDGSIKPFLPGSNFAIITLLGERVSIAMDRHRTPLCNKCKRGAATARRLVALSKKEPIGVAMRRA